MYALLLSATKHISQERAICNFAPKILYLKLYADLMSLESCQRIGIGQSCHFILLVSIVYEWQKHTKGHKDVQ